MPHFFNRLIGLLMSRNCQTEAGRQAVVRKSMATPPPIHDSHSGRCVAMAPGRRGEGESEAAATGFANCPADSVVHVEMIGDRSPDAWRLTVESGDEDDAACRNHALGQRG